ncbi:septin [Saccharomycopsis crataegensis]|uniref:Septin n=1 Tax=Saccharomycopsis crataegensis TaxID=43959 RepID=A0AAV5QUT5_9ASCO|nr:septin [Saccharomycopsis crataegensis]
MNFLSSSALRRKKDTRRGVKFTIMVVGQSGIGKSTFVNTLLDTKIVPHKYEPIGTTIDEPKIASFSTIDDSSTINAAVFQRDFNPALADQEPGIAITESEVEILNKGDYSRIFLNVINTPGFGDNIDNEVCFEEIINYLKQQFDIVLAEETKFKRNPKFKDTRVHACLYFITPTGHGLRELDVEIIKKLSKYVNIIPVIGRADSFTKEELADFKRNILYDIEKFNVPVFQFTYDDDEEAIPEEDEMSDEEENILSENKYLQSIQPFAIISSEDEIEIDGKSIKGRQYPWGFIDIHNPEYSDFKLLKNVLLSTHLQDLKDLTHDYLYENYRTEKLRAVNGINDETTPETKKKEFLGSRDSYIPEPPSLSNLNALANIKDSMILEEQNEKDFANILDSAQLNSQPSISSFAQETISSQKSIDSKNRSQLRLLSETVPYALKQEQIQQRKQKLAELEAKSAKEMKLKEEALEKKALELKLREQELLAKMSELGISGNASFASDN